VIEDIIEQAVPLTGAVGRLDEIHDSGPTAAAVITAEIGADMSHFLPRGISRPAPASHPG
jgi:hypothetical protein